MSRQPRHRLGVVVEVGEPARAALAKAVEPLMSAYPGVGWVPPTSWYVEVCALGALEPERGDDVDAIVSATARNTARVALRLDGGAGIDDGCVIFAGVCHSDALLELRDELIVRLMTCGVHVADGEFVAQCEIGRASGGTRLPSSLARSFRGPMVTWTARRLLVVRTRLRVGGVAHEIRAGCEFGLPVAALP